jgi:NADPH2:quinone reductase
MLVRICLDGVPLVNVVQAEQVDVLRDRRRSRVCNSSAPTFRRPDQALAAAGATVAFGDQRRVVGRPDPHRHGGGHHRTAKEYSRYGSTTHKQVYIYGSLDRGPTEFTRTFGAAWGIGGWLLTPFLQKIGFEAAQKLRERVAAEVKTTFARSYTKEISLAQALALEEIAVYGKMSTGAKYLINPNSGPSRGLR